MDIIVILIILFVLYNSARAYLSIVDWLVPGWGFAIDLHEDIASSEIPVFYDNWDNMSKGLFLNELEVAKHIIWIRETCSYYYYKTNPSVYQDIYHYFRYDFLKWSEFAALKLLIVAVIFFLPVAIYESYEYGFPKEYFYVIPAACYSAFLWYFCTMYFEVTINFVQNSWFLNELYEVPEIDIWIEFIYINRNEPYVVTKTKQFYNFLFVVESINAPVIEEWEDFVYFDEDNRKSLIITFYNKYLWWLTPRPKKIKWPRWR